MIRFIDLESKKVFDGSMPYVFNVGKGESTGKWVSEPLVVLSDAGGEWLVLEFPEDSPFWLVDLSGAVEEEINSFRYIDLSSIKRHSVTLKGQRTDNGMYVFKANVVCMSDTDGETHDFLKIIEPSQYGGGSYKFEFAVDTYGEDERLPVGVSNMGLEMPKQFQRAVYDSNVRDESDDNILLNRKWKELMIEYWSIIANKGSYDSLLNSLKFFEYGDLVKINEYWRYTDRFGVETLKNRDIEQILDKDIRRYLDVVSKTTYISLDMALCGASDGYVTIPEGTLTETPDKFIPEPVPQLEYLSLKWSVDDLVLKMTLLANYFSTYFMPIHLDLIHASVYRTVFSSCIKILHSVRVRREDRWDDQDSISCNLWWYTDYWLGNVTAFNYPDTAFRNSDIPAYWGDLSMVGIDPSSDKEIDFTEYGEEELIKYANQYFGGVGVIVPVECSFYRRDFIKSSEISVYRQEDGSNYSLVTHYKSYTPIEEDFLQFHLVFVKSGRYLIQLQFTDADGLTSTGSWYIQVHGSIGNLISVKRLRKIDYSTVDSSKMFDDWFYDNLDFNSFMFTEPFDEQMKYKQWLVRSDGMEVDGIGMNQLLVIDCGPTGIERKIRITCGAKGSKEFEFSSIETDGKPAIIRELEEEYPWYWWKLLSRPVAKRKKKGGMDITGEYRYYIVGVRKYFDNSSDSRYRTVFEDYIKTYRDGELDTIDVVKVVHVSSEGRSRGLVEITAPVGTTIKIGRTEYIQDSITSTIPVSKDKTSIELEYTSGGHVFYKSMVVDDMLNQLGSPSYVLHSDKKRGYTTIEEPRFFPVFHHLEELQGSTASIKDVVVCLPDFTRVDKEVTGTRWEFVNATTGEVIYSKSFKECEDSGEKLYIEEPFVGKYDFKNSLTRGYYDIILHFTMGGTEQTETVLSAFRIE